MGKRKRNTDLPLTIDDAILGRLRFTAALDGIDEHESKTKFGGKPVTITLYTDETGSLRRCIYRARKTLERLSFDLARMHKYIEKHVFLNYNAVWREGQYQSQLRISHFRRLTGVVAIL